MDEKLIEILKLCRQMNSLQDRTALLDLIAREAARLMDADRASIFLLDHERNQLWSQVALGSDEILQLDVDVGIAGAVVRNGETINVQDAQRDSRFYPGTDAKTGYHTKSVLAAPLQLPDGHIIGAFEVLNKHQGVFTPADEDLLRTLASHGAIAIQTVETVEELRRHRDQLLQENAQLWQDVDERFSKTPLLGTSEKIQAVVRLIEQIRNSSVTVLITGESGTGKELAAKAIHYSSPRARRPLVALNCAALPENLIESELFGIERGVATGVERRIGKFETASGSTLFLDEIGDLSLPAQAKLLRVLQERVIERVGGRKSILVDVRIVVATNKDLEAEAKKGVFREDLFHRLNVVHIEMPPLREISGDIPLLANHFMTTYCREMKRDPMMLTPAALSRLKRYHWPGNVRALENEMKRLVVTARGSTITEDVLSDAIRLGGGEGILGESATSVQIAETSRNESSLKEAVSELEKRLILEALAKCRQNQGLTARTLGVSRQGLIKKMKRYGITSERAS